MSKQGKGTRAVVVAVLLSGLGALAWTMGLEGRQWERLCGELYLFPIALGGLWFGLRGGLITSLLATGLALPLIVMRWEGWTPADAERILRIVLFNGLAALVGRLRDRERASHRQVLASENLAAIGTTVAAVAHEMRAPLTAIGGFAGLVHRALTEKDSNRAKLEIVIQETLRLERLMNDLLDYARPLGLHPLPVDPNALARSALTMLESSAESAQVELVPRLAQGLPAVMLDSMRVEQVIRNLLQNAIEASPPGGHVTVRTALDAEGVCFEVADSGPGIPKGEREAVLDPFFTTKRKGTGLGLPIAKTIIEAHGGALTILDTSERGAVFRVRLPVSGVVSSRAELRPPAERSRSTRETQGTQGVRGDDMGVAERLDGC